MAQEYVARRTPATVESLMMMAERTFGPTDAQESPAAASDDPWSLAETITWGPSRYLTRFRGLWTDTAMFVRFDAADDEPWHTMTNRDDHIWEEEVVEIFLDPESKGIDYAELEISPANVVCDLIVRRPWPNLRSDPAWHIRDLETRVVPWRDRESGPSGWTALAKIPWSGLLPIASDVAVPPRAGSVWAFNVYRIKRPGGPSKPEEGVILAAW